ncbi:hypothetical protein FOS14_08835 [Skermania sp. ID1734]|uniref:hypothetical protein n=1 Tax=Skermania sp. ID1734 TaxID=2597516 RepID=UPI0011806886|nr:hypothetical protein [Skermania sp. ID1734]TSD99933.1 hypothetical protein FOS14_08835 [Skermania sp. ID1734]
MATENNVILLTWQVPQPCKAPEAYRLLSDLGSTGAIDVLGVAVIEHVSDGQFAFRDDAGKSVPLDEFGDTALKDVLKTLDGPLGPVIAASADTTSADGANASADDVHSPAHWSSLTEITKRLHPGRPGVIAQVQITDRHPIDKIVSDTYSSIMRIHEHDALREIRAAKHSHELRAAEADVDKAVKHEDHAGHHIIDKIKEKFS